jgi:hypothetical protein
VPNKHYSAGFFLFIKAALGAFKYNNNPINNKPNIPLEVDLYEFKDPQDHEPSP